MVSQPAHPAIPPPILFSRPPPRHPRQTRRPAPSTPAPAGRPDRVEDLFPTLTRRKAGPWLAHRLDADTSGCLAIALTKTALIATQQAFATGRVRKTYWALTAGAPTATPSGQIDAPLLKRIPPLAGWRMHPDPAGDPAITDWRVLATEHGISLLELHPRTGRTHQIRVHCALLGCPILGDDPLYGNARRHARPPRARALHICRSTRPSRP